LEFGGHALFDVSDVVGDRGKAAIQPLFKFADFPLRVAKPLSTTFVSASIFCSTVFLAAIGGKYSTRVFIALM
jgi:hypothetical protein